MSAAQANGSMRERFLEAMGRLASTVCVVTTDGPAGRGGLTVSAMASVSADGPAPTLLVCVNHQASAAPLILVNGVFGVNVLRYEQSTISDVFAARTEVSETRRFDGLAWAPMASGAPRLAGVLAAFDCRVLSTERVGTHHVFIATVGDIHIGEPGDALVYASRRYAVAAPR